jgi:hypothetical protein
VAGGVGVLRLDGRVQRLDRLDRAALEPRVRLEELLRAQPQRVVLPTELPRRLPDEERERGVEDGEHDRDADPDRAPRAGDPAHDVGCVRVHLVRADDGAARAADGRVHLDRVVRAESRLGGVLGIVERLELAIRPSGERPGQVACERVARADPLGVDARPEQLAVAAPELHAEQAGMVAERRVEPRCAADVEPVAAHDARAHDGVRLALDVPRLVRDRRLRHRALEEPREADGAREEDRRRRDEEDAQERERANERATTSGRSHGCDDRQQRRAG